MLATIQDVAGKTFDYIIVGTSVGTYLLFAPVLNRNTGGGVRSFSIR